MAKERAQNMTHKGTDIARVQCARVRNLEEVCGTEVYKIPVCQLKIRGIVKCRLMLTRTIGMPAAAMKEYVSCRSFRRLPITAELVVEHICSLRVSRCLETVPLFSTFL